MIGVGARSGKWKESVEWVSIIERGGMRGPSGGRRFICLLHVGGVHMEETDQMNVLGRCSWSWVKRVL